jgi:hypothetical protein
MKKRIAGLFVVVVLLIVACTPETVSFPKGQYWGPYWNWGDSFITFEDGDKFTVKLPDDTFLIKEGQYTVDGDILTLLDTEICGPGLIKGEYRWSVDENGHLHLDEIKDSCHGRTVGETRWELEE